MNQNALREKGVFSLVISMGVPMAFSMLINSLYNIVDGYFVARISEKAMTAVSLVFPLQYAASAIAIGFGVGINAAVAFFLGAGNKKQADQAASLGFLLSILHGIALMIAIPLAAEPFLLSFTSDPQILDYGVTYLDTVMLFTVFMQVQLVFEKLFQAVGSMKIPVICLTSGCVLNIILDPVMIFGMGPIPAMGIAGAAWATNIGTVLPLVLYLFFTGRGRLPLSLSPKDGLQGRGLAGRLYSVGIPSAFSMSLQSVMVALLNMVLAGFPGQGVLILGVYYKLQSFIYLTASGIVQGIRPPVAYNYGAGDLKRVRGIFRAAAVINLAVMCAGTVLCLLIPGQLIGLFTTNPDTTLQGEAALRIICIGFPVSALSVTAAGTLEGLGRGLDSFVISLVRCVALLVPLAFIFSRYAGVTGVWTAFPVTEFLAAGLSMLLYGNGIRKSEAKLAASGSQE